QLCDSISGTENVSSPAFVDREISTCMSDSRLPSGPRRSSAALRACVKLFNKRAEFRVHSPRLLPRRGFHQFLAMLVHFSATVGANHFGFGFRHWCSCLFQSDVFSAVSQCGGHPDQFVQKFFRSSHKGGVEEIAGFIEKFEDIAKVDIEENRNEAQLAHRGKAV